MDFTSQAGSDIEFILLALGLERLTDVWQIEQSWRCTTIFRNLSEVTIILKPYYLPYIHHEVT